MSEIQSLYKCSKCGFKGTFKEVAENEKCIKECKPDRNIVLAEGLPCTVDPKVEEYKKTEFEKEQEQKDMIVELHITIDKSKMPYVPKIHIFPKFVEDAALMGQVVDRYIANIVTMHVQPQQSRIVTPGQAAQQMQKRMPMKIRV